MSSVVLVSREVECPLCGEFFDYSRPKDHTYALIRRDTDHCPYYSGANPNLYAVWVCPGCRFAAFKNDFKVLEEHSREPLLKALSESPLTKAVDFRKQERSLYTAMRSYELAKLCYKVRRFPAIVQAGLALRTAWVCRYAGELRREVLFLKDARDLYKEAFDKGVHHDGNVDDLAVAYLIGELMLRTGDIAGSQQYFMLLAQASDTKDTLDRAAKDRLYDAKSALKTREVLESTPLFEPIESEHIDLIAVNSEMVKVPHGKVLCRKGEPSHSMYVISAGQARVYLGDPDNSSPVAVLGPGEAVGEMSLFLGAPRSATVVAGEDDERQASNGALEVVEIAKTAFRNVVMLEPKVAQAFATLISERKHQNEVYGSTHVALEVANDEAPGDDPEAVPVGAPQQTAEGKAQYTSILSKIWTALGVSGSD